MGFFKLTTQQHIKKKLLSRFLILELMSLYLKYVDSIYSEIQNLDKLNLHLPFSSLFEDYQGILAYEDMLHLAKCYRYLLICQSYISHSLSHSNSYQKKNIQSQLKVKDIIFTSCFFLHTCYQLCDVHRTNISLHMMI